MKRQYQYKTQSTCSRSIYITTCDGRVESVTFEGGCNGNLKGIGMLVKGMGYDEIIYRLEGITCGVKSTSCPDQLARALHQIKETEIAQETSGSKDMNI